MFFPLAHKLAELHQETLLEEAKQNQVVARSRADRARLGVRVLVGLGVLLISMGLRLHGLGGPEMRPAPESCCPS
jgi:hypothetical protein